jgi:gliding motility-associated-like protein
MNRLSTFLMSGLLCFLTTFAMAQGPTFTISPQTQSVTAGSAVSFTVNVSNFTNLEGLQYSMSWDATKLSYVNTTDYTLGGLTGGSFAPNGNSKLAVSWVTATGQPVSYPNGLLYKVNFTALTTGVVDFQFSNVPTPAEVTGAGSTDLTSSAVFSPAIGTGGSGGTGGSTCAAPSGISVTPGPSGAMASWSAVTGATSYNVQYKLTSATTWSSAPSTAAPSFTLPNLVTCSDYQLQVQSICASGASPFSSSVDFKTLGCSTGGGTGGTGGSCWDCATKNNLNGFGLIFSDAYTDIPGSDVNVKLHVNGFNKIESMQFEINWDPTQLQYKGVTTNLAGLNLASFNTTNAANGKITMSWVDQSSGLAGVSLPSCTSIMDLQFKTLGAANSTASVSINKSASAPLPLEVQVNNVTLVIPASNIVNGTVFIKKCDGVAPPVPSPCVAPVYDKTFNISQVAVNSLGQVCVDVIANNFIDAEGFQLTMKWDPQELSYIAVKKPNSGGLFDLQASEYNDLDAKNGMLTMSYNHPEAPKNFPNQTALFQVCFTAVGNNGTTAKVRFDPLPLPFEVYVGSALMPNATTKDGKVIIAETPNVTIKEVSPSCSGAKTGVMMAEVLPAGTYSYAWTTGTTAVGATQTISNLGSGPAYKVKVTNTTSCLTGENTAYISNKAAPKIPKIGVNATGTGLIVEAINATDYSWANSNAPNVVIGKTKELSPIPSGRYNVTVTNINTGCSKDTFAYFFRGKVTNAKCGGDGKVEIEDGGLSNVTYSWSPNVSTGATASNLDKQTYKVNITAGGQLTTQDFIVDGPAALKISSITVTNAPNGSIAISNTGGTGNVTYLWSNKATTATITNLPYGIYTVTLTDANGCTATHTTAGLNYNKGIDVQCAPLVLASNKVTVVNTTCGENNGEIVIAPFGGSGDFTIIWSNNLASGKKVTALASGSYNVTVVDNQCPSQIKYPDIVVEASTKPMVQLDQAIDAKDNCVGAITLKITSGVGPYTYTWSANANGQKVKDPVGLCEGVYKVTVTDSKGCVASAIADITVTGTSVPVEGTNTKLTLSKCPNSSDGKIEASIIGGKAPLTYAWTYNGGAFAGNSNVISNLLPGKYKVLVTDALGKTFTKEYVLTSESLLNYNVKITDPIPNSAKNGAAKIEIVDGVAPYTYLWSNGATTNQINNLSLGSYAVTVTDSKGCSFVKTFPIGDVGAVEIVVRTNFNGVNIRCAGMCNAIAEVKNVGDAKAPLIFKWSTGDTSRTAKGLCVGTHKVTVTDANKEIFEGSVNIVGPDKINVVLKTTDATNGTDGRAEAVVTGGTAPFVYRWSTEASTSTIVNQKTGRVFVMVSDANGCESFKDGIIGPNGTDAPCFTTSIPVITPDADGYNDFLDIYCLDDYPNNQVDVFNRYGQLVFSKANYINRSWMPVDSKGIALPEGGYFYVVTIVRPNGVRETEKGSFSILNR